MAGFVVIIPARLASTRCRANARRSCGANRWCSRRAPRCAKAVPTLVVVASDSDEVLAACRRFEVTAVLTRADHPTARPPCRGRRRAAAHRRDDRPSTCRAMSRCCRRRCGAFADLLAQRPDCALATAAHPLTDAAEFFNPNVSRWSPTPAAGAAVSRGAPIPFGHATHLPSLASTCRPSLPAVAARRPVSPIGRASCAPLPPRCRGHRSSRAGETERLRAPVARLGIAVLPLAQPLPPGVRYTAGSRSSARAACRRLAATRS